MSLGTLCLIVSALAPLGHTRIAASGPGVYVVYEDEHANAFVRHYAETSSGIEPNRPKVPVNHPLTGIGPGLDGSLLLVGPADGGRVVERMTRGVIKKVCAFPIGTWIDPIDTLSETKDFLMLQSFGGEETPTVKTFLYATSWVGPYITDGNSLQIPVNSDRSIWTSQGADRWTVFKKFKSLTSDFYYQSFPDAFIEFNRDKPKRIVPVMNLAKDRVALYVEGKQDSWLATIRGRTLRVYRANGIGRYFPDQLLFDSRGRIWELESDLRFKRIPLKLISQHELDY